MSEIFPKNVNIKQAVLSTLAYFHLFKVPLSEEEVVEHLLAIEPDKEKIHLYLKESPLVKSKKGYYSLDTEEDWEAFEEKIKHSRRLWKKLRRWQWILSLCPFVRLVCVCNSLPIYAVDEESDIDLLVVTQKNRLFLARFFLTLLTSLCAIRRHGNKVAGRFCLSFYVDETALDFATIALKPQDIYLAYWVKTLEPVSGDFSTYEKLLQCNHYWLEAYFKTLRPHRRYFRKSTAAQEKIKSTLEKFLNRESWEAFVRAKQMHRAKEKYSTLKNPSGTVISEHMLKFHNEDRREAIQKSWITLLKERAFL